MRRSLIILILTAAALLLLCGCGSVFEREYVYEGNYSPAPQNAGRDADKITVTSFAELRQALLDLALAGKAESTILFDQTYEGDATEDLASACWQVRTQDALCAYCVENIAYDLTHIVTYYEAKISITYSDMAKEVGDIVRLQYSTGVEEIIKTAIENGAVKLVVLIQRGTYSAEAMELLVSRVYNEDPGIAPREPTANVNLFSGTGTQRLYEISIRYGMTAQELETRRAELASIEPFVDMNTDELDEANSALAACEYLVANCRYTEESQYGSIYSALVQGQATSRGMALAYVKLCGSLGLNCQIVNGQYNWQDHYWNIVEIDGSYYHVDPAACVQYGLETGFLLRDESMWGLYRWNVASYPACDGELTYWKLVGLTPAAGLGQENQEDQSTDDNDAGEDVTDSTLPNDEPSSGQNENNGDSI